MKKLLLPVLLILAVTMISFGYAQTSGGGGGGGSSGGSSLGLYIAEPSNGTTFVNSNVDILIQARTAIEASCDFSAKVCDDSNVCKDIIYKSCPFCDLDSSYFTLANAYYDAVPGWDYNVKVTCRNASGSSQSKEVSFKTEGNENDDGIAPIINLQSPINNVKHVPNTYLEFEVNELAHCEYTLASGNGAGHISIPGYINNYKKLMSLTEGNTTL